MKGKIRRETDKIGKSPSDLTSARIEPVCKKRMCEGSFTHYEDRMDCSVPPFTYPVKPSQMQIHIRRSHAVLRENF
ncbi:hypothetical protein DICVIV_11559 [Dictyocaulus viviparus]|uniref:Uncharacterized protein n=1 Tax=Dictyocaulus viviparus TaxID=29172 RepID=A0A0D8XCW9_DICVI|nr:hypothetical protein DICVIV_11559 [Dictyocaulus viviparus]